MLAMAKPGVDVVLHEIAAPSATSSRCRSRGARQVRRDVGRRTCSSSMSRSSRTSARPVSSRPSPRSIRGGPARARHPARRARLPLRPRRTGQREAQDLPHVRRRRDAVISCPDAPSIYEIPKVLHDEGLDAYVVRRPQPLLPRRELEAGTTCSSASTARKRTHDALVGKYIDLPDAYCRYRGAARRAFANWAKVPSNGCVGRLRDSEARRTHWALSTGSSYLVASAFVASRQDRLRFATPEKPGAHPRTVPRSPVHGDESPATSLVSRAPLDRVRPRHGPPVIATMAEQVKIVSGDGDMGGTMRLGSYPPSSPAGPS